MTEKQVDKESDKSSKLLEIALDARQFELDLFWRRALFFWGFIASAFIGFASTYPNQPIAALTISCFGFICSLAWTLVNRGSKYWYENWEIKVKKVGGNEIKKMFGEVNIIRIVSMGKPILHSETNRLRVPYEVEIEMEGKISLLKRQGPLVQHLAGQPGRWAICGF